MNIQKILPSKQFRKVFLIILLLIGAISLVGAVANKKTNYTQNKKSEGQVIVVSEAIEKDTDKDGLKDWEESLWGMDPNNKDTNGDGISDGEQIQKIQTILNKNNTETQKTYTDSVTKEIVTLVATLNAKNQLDQNSQAVLVNELANFLKKNPQKKVYTNEDIIETPGSTSKEIGKYKKTVDTLLIQNMFTPEEIVYFKNFELQADENNHAIYTRIAKKSNQLVTSLQKTPVPKILLNKHLSLINSLEKMKEIAESFNSYETDPLLTLVSTTEAGATTDYIMVILQEILNTK